METINKNNIEEHIAQADEARQNDNQRIMHEIENCLQKGVELSEEDYNAQFETAKGVVDEMVNEQGEEISEEVRHLRVRDNFYGVCINLLHNAVATATLATERLEQLQAQINEQNAILKIAFETKLIQANEKFKAKKAQEESKEEEV